MQSQLFVYTNNWNLLSYQEEHCYFTLAIGALLETTTKGNIRLNALQFFGIRKLDARVLPDPFTVVGDLGVDSRIVWISAPVTPGHNTSQLAVDSHGATRVTLAGVPTALAVIRSADLALEDTVLSFLHFVRCHAGLLVDDGNRDTLELAFVGFLVSLAPAGDDGPRAGMCDFPSLIAIIHHMSILR